MRGSRVEYLWRRLLLSEEFCGPILDRPAHEISTSDVADILRPVWHTKPEIARKLYPAIRRTFELARIELRDRHDIIFANPARWDDLKALEFESPRALSRGHHPALPYQRLPEFMAALRVRGGLGSLLLETIILTNVRTGTALLAKFDQFDCEAGVWSVPPENLKDRKHRKEAFRVPLPPRIVEIVRFMDSVRQSDFVFRGRAPEAPMSSFAAMSTIERMNGDDPIWIDPASGRKITPHGFRSSFRNWAAETQSTPHAVIELSMGHHVAAAVECAYLRADLLEQRRALILAWADHCEGARS